MALQPTSSQPSSSQPSSSQPAFDYKLEMSTAHLLGQITTDVRKHAPTAKVSISPDSTWIAALAVASKSLEDQDQATLIFPEISKERREAIKKLVLSERPRSSTNIPAGLSASIGRRIRTPFPKDVNPPPATPEAKERIRKLARETLCTGLSATRTR
jgi:predicted component of type VI protein secretion system